MKQHNQNKPAFILTQHVKKGDQFVGSDIFNKPIISFFTDASVMEQTLISGYGISNDTIQVSFRKEIKTKNNNVAEVIAIKYAIKIAIDMGLTDLEVFTDSLPAIEHIRRFRATQHTSEIFLIHLNEIIHDLKKFNTYKIHWIPRHRNLLADAMSKSNFNYDNFF